MQSRVTSTRFRKENQMTTSDKLRRPIDLPVDPPTRSPAERKLGIHERRRERTAARKRRVLARWLRRTANRPPPDPIARCREPLLHHRAAAVRSELLEIATMLERTPDPDPAIIAQLHNLLANGCDSPLYNPDIHVSELRATVHYLRARLLVHDRRTGSAVPPRTASRD
jgi:hypothetical protein